VTVVWLTGCARFQKTRNRPRCLVSKLRCHFPPKKPRARGGSGGASDPWFCGLTGLVAFASMHEIMGRV